MSGPRKFILSQVQHAKLLSSRIAAAHGLGAFKTKFYTIPDDLGLADEADILGSGLGAGKLVETTYLLNSQVYDTVTFTGSDGGDIKYYDTNSGQVIPVPKMQIPIALCTVTKNITIAKSDIAGRNGTIKQYINTGDYEVVIKGIFTTGVSDKYPENAMKHLQRITNASSEVKVASKFLQLFDISYLVFTKCEFDQAEADGRDIQKFTLTCLSETPFAIKVTQQQGFGETTSSPFTTSFANSPQSQNIVPFF